MLCRQLGFLLIVSGRGFYVKKIDLALKYSIIKTTRGKVIIVYNVTVQGHVVNETK